MLAESGGFVPERGQLALIVTVMCGAGLLDQAATVGRLTA